MPRYWVYIDSKVQGPVDVPALRKITGFTLLTQVCAENEQTWRMADEMIEIKSYFLSPPRASALMAEAVNAEPLPKETGVLLSVIDPKPVIESPRPEPVVKLPVAELPAAVEGQKEPSGPGALRLNCEICGYKNPRDVTACMKCGTALKIGATAPILSSPNASVGDPPIMDSRQQPAGMTKAAEPAPEKILVPSPAPIKASEPAVTPVDLKANQMVEIPVTRILITLLAASLAGAFGFGGYRFWMMHHHRPHTVAARPPAVVSTQPLYKSKRVVSRHRRRVVRRTRAAILPGITPIQTSPTSAREKRAAEPPAEQPQTDTSYRVIEEAAPLKHRQSAPVNSPYAVKRRKNAALWSTQEQQAIEQVQRFRIYGGQRTMERNADILMQILRDREYDTAFETGKRLYLYNDMDWGVTQKDGPVYEVRLTFSGGKESDGTPRLPLKFAFAADLERGSVEPTGDERVQSNTMHAFFDESRIPPEDRRAIAKDVEELVLAAQPDGSPLALDTVARHFEETYNAAAVQRVANAFSLNLVAKKIEHEPKIIPEKPAAEAPTETKKTSPVKLAPILHSDKDEFQMDNGSGREKLVAVNTPSQASAGRIWEVLTNYDGLKQFVPDLLVSEREGQDGGAIIVHTVSLSRVLFFVFKVNLHLRLIEHPDQHTIEFERIAGEFEEFKGAIELKSESAGGPTMIAFHASVVPQSYMPAWILRDMAKRFLVPVLDALRVRAESN